MGTISGGNRRIALVLRQRDAAIALQRKPIAHDEVIEILEPKSLPRFMGWFR